MKSVKHWGQYLQPSYLLNQNDLTVEELLYSTTWWESKVYRQRAHAPFSNPFCECFKMSHWGLFHRLFVNLADSCKCFLSCAPCVAFINADYFTDLLTGSCIWICIEEQQQQVAGARVLTMLSSSGSNNRCTMGVIITAWEGRGRRGGGLEKNV